MLIYMVDRKTLVFVGDEGFKKKLKKILLFYKNNVILDNVLTHRCHCAAVPPGGLERPGFFLLKKKRTLISK